MLTDVFRWSQMLRWVLWAWWNLMIISNESMDLNGPKEFDDPQLFNDPSYSMIPAIQWSPAIRWLIGSMDFDNPKVYGDTSFTDGLVFKLKPIIITLTMSFLWPFQPAALYITSQNQYQQNMSFCICRDGSIVQNRIRCQIIQWLRITEWLQGKLFDFFFA